MIALSMGHGKAFMRRVCNLVATLPLRNTVTLTYIRYDSHAALSILIAKHPKASSKYQEITHAWRRTWTRESGRWAWVSDAKRGIAPRSPFSFARALFT